MTLDTDAVRRHAAVVSAEQLARANGRLRTLSPDRQDAVSELVSTVADGIAACLVAEARRNRPLAEALAAIYGRRDSETAAP